MCTKTSPLNIQCVQFSHSVVSNSVNPWTAAHQASMSITNSQSLLKLMSIASVMPSNHLILCHPSLLPTSIFRVSGSFPMSQFFPTGGQSIGASAWILPMNVQDWFPLEMNGLISLQSEGLSTVFFNTSRNSQVFSPTPQFERINSLAFSLLYGPALTSIHDSWENHSFGYMDLCQQSNVSAF